MKKIIFSLIILLGVMCLTGCDSSSVAVDGMLATLKKEGIVDKKIELIDKVIDINAVGVPSRKTYYIYENRNDELIAIRYDTNMYSKNDYDYTIKIYSNVTINNDIEYLDEDDSAGYYYIYSDGRKSESSKYNFGSLKEYHVYKKKTLFFKTKYKLVEVN